MKFFPSYYIRCNSADKVPSRRRSTVTTEASIMVGYIIHKMVYLVTLIIILRVFGERCIPSSQQYNQYSILFFCIMHISVMLSPSEHHNRTLASLRILSLFCCHYLKVRFTACLLQCQANTSDGNWMEILLWARTRRVDWKWSKGRERKNSMTQAMYNHDQYNI